MTFGYRFLTLGAIENDHYVALARAHQVLHGDFPVRDFEDPGMPLAYLLSAGAAAIFGPTLLTDAVLGIAMLSAAAGITMLLAHRASGSRLVAIAVVALALLAAPRLYSAPKVLLPLVSIWLGWRYADAPTDRRLVAAAAWTAVAFLFRHDHVVYIGAATAVLIALTNGESHQLRLRRVATYAAWTLAFTVPWLSYVQWALGLPEYFAAALRFSMAEADRTFGGWPTLAALWMPPWTGPSTVAFLALTLLPLVALAMVVRPGRHLGAPHLSLLSVLTLLSTVAFLRDDLATRAPDVIGTTTILLACVAGRFLSARAVAPTVVVAVLSFLILLTVATPQRTVRRLHLPSPPEVVRRALLVATRLHRGADEITPNPSFAPLVRYLKRCAPPSGRVLVSGFAPQIPVLSGRAYAGGLPAWIPGYYEHAADVQRARVRLEREPVAVAVMLEGSDVFVRAWPTLAESLRAKGLVEFTAGAAPNGIVLWIPAPAPNTPVDPATALPCPPRP